MRIRSQVKQKRREQGATAIFVAILATLILSMAALSVDLGNAWARKRDVQTQVDVSALSAGHLLPAITAVQINAVAREVASYLNTDNNQAVGQDAVTAAQLLDGDFTNGEAEITNDGKTLRVVSPPARVNFSFGPVLGSNSANIQAEATVELQSKLPPVGKVLPFAVPDGCPFGPGMADTTGPRRSTETSGTYTFSSARSGTVNAVTHTPNPLPGGYDIGDAAATVTLGDLPNNTKVTETQVLFQRGGVGYLRQPTSWTNPAGAPVGDTSNTDKVRTMTVPIPQEVLDGPGTWYVHGFVANKHTTADSAKTLVVGDFATPSNEISCASSASGQFGQMYSPRDNQAPDQRALGLNIAEGIDHVIRMHPGPGDPDCGQKNTDPSLPSIHDKVDEVDPNCVLPQVGNDGPWMLQGLITGLEGVEGRLDATRDNGRTTCGPPAGRATDVTREGVAINNDVLSCFLANGYNLDYLTRTNLSEEDVAGVLSETVTDSPRFAWIPVIFPATRAQIDNNTFYKVRRFVPVFITDETRASTKTSSDASADNGIVIDGQLAALHVFMFHPSFLPKDERSPTTVYDPLMGRTITLID